MENIQKQSFVRVLSLGTIWALSISLILILVFAFCLRIFSFGETTIVAIVQTIKGISILFGVFMALRKSKTMGIINGMLIGLSFILLSFLVFSMLDGFNFDFSTTLLNDILLGSVIGGISGVIAVNLKSK